MLRKVIDIFRKSIRSPTLATLSIFAGANVVGTVLSGLGGLIQARWIAPDVLGQFQKYTILASYLTFFLVVVQDGFSRQFPYLIGQGRKEEAMRIAATAKTWYVAASVLFSLIFFVLACRAFLISDYRGLAGWGVQIVASIAGSYGVYMQTVYRRSLEFKRLSYNGLISSVLGFGSLIVVKVLGYYGLAIKSLVLSMSRVMLDAKYIPVKVKMAWDLRSFISIARISIPLSVEGYIRTSFLSATFSYFVIRYCGERDLGLVGIAAAFEGFASIFLMSLFQIFDVKVTSKFGETDSFVESFKSLLKPTVFGVFCSAVCAVLLCLLIKPVVVFCVPNYVDAVPIVYLLSLQLPLTSLSLPTRILRVALLYRSIYAISLIRVLFFVGAVLCVPKTVLWIAGCKVAAEFLSILFAYGMTLYHLQAEIGKRRMHV